ncbi:Putative secreted protein [Sphingopyxis fribergensis]|uniref:Putative secreted protein n=1 Tax=Sphingopyxis fribergensis TaxID=1515612 RepID=A0A0A7PT34_9SPHN|nr:hypothetical protein [Sphingopyxis fribergensis]AJA11187.1 Putative secreted protein [Sphingopyxis fribergensis]
MTLDLTRCDLAFSSIAALAAAALPHAIAMAQVPTRSAVNLSLVDPELRAAAREAAPIPTRCPRPRFHPRAIGGKVPAFDANVPADRR